tara:strand:+ start:722 stop:883 length:162 start_codon:yes stop_codon:yes gene_type:complete
MVLILKFFRNKFIDSPLCAPTSKNILKFLNPFLCKNLIIFFDEKNQKYLKLLK